MKGTIVISKKGVKLRNPILIEGLPGIGLVGKLATEHLIKELKAEKVAEVYSKHFPHQVLMRKKGTLRMLKNKFYAWRNPKKGKSDLLMLVGDVQAITPEAQFEVCNALLDYFEKMNGKRIYTLGGYGVGKIVENPRVLGSATHKEVVEELKKYGVVFGEATGSIIGAAGLLLGIGKIRKMEGACLMGETHGGYVDAKSAKSVLNVLTKILGVNINLNKLDERVKETEKFMNRMEKEMEKQKGMSEGGPKSDALSYIR
ncbi:MAG: proteasome assembly chaperone family protein [Candidatus Micrarchaeota archaeon]|nr:proteasome assembly chaperone family protein [Candidatus Micrarchaeota archaeon]